VPHVALDDRRDRVDVAGEAVDRVGGAPAAGLVEPARVGEVVQRHHGGDAALDRAFDHAPVVIEVGLRHLAAGGLDAGPFDAEPVGAQPGPGQEVHVDRPAVVAVGGRAARFTSDAVTALLEGPPVAVGVVALCLVRRGGGTPQEAGRQETGRRRS
jgi:hypothetical protein